MTKTATPADDTISLLNGWKNLLAPPVSLSDRRAAGKALREQCPRTAHGDWSPPKHRKSALDLLRSQDQKRQEDLIPIRYHRMKESPFAFYRGAALVMASDIADCNVPDCWFSCAVIAICRTSGCLPPPNEMLFLI